MSLDHRLFRYERDYGSSAIHEQLGVGVSSGVEVGVHDEEGVDSGEVSERGISKNGCDWMRACINDACDSDLERSHEF